MNIPLNIDWQQILLHLLNFAILAVGLYLLLFKPVKKFMDSRRQYYEEIDLEAKRAVEESKRLEEEYKSKLDSINDDIIKLKAEASKHSDAEIKQQLEEAKKRADKIISDAEIQALADKDKILKNAQNDIANMIVTAMEKLALNANGSSSNNSEIYDRFLNSVEKEETDERSR